MSPKLDEGVLKDVFGSDFEKSEEDEPSEQPAGVPSSSQKGVPFPRKAPVMPDSNSDEETTPVPQSPRRPIIFLDSDDDDEPSPRRQKRRTRTSRSPGNQVKARKLSKEHRRHGGEGFSKDNSVNGRPNVKRKRRDSYVQRPKSDGQSNKETKSEIGNKKDEGDAMSLMKPKACFAEVLEEVRAIRSPQKKFDIHTIEAHCIDFVSRMIQARNEDTEAYGSRRPALRKLKMLREVEETYTNVQYKEPLLENNFLAVIKTWLEPYSDGVLPNFQIRKSLLNVLASVPINEELIDRLKKSRGLGFVIHYLSKKDDHAPTKRAAEKLLQRWFRLITNTNDRLNVFSDDLDTPNKKRVFRGSAFSADNKVAKKAIAELQTKRERLLPRNAENEQVFASVPHAGKFLYDVIPEENEEIDGQPAKKKRKGSRKKNGDKHEDAGISRQLARLRKSSGCQKRPKPSVNGR